MARGKGKRIAKRIGGSTRRAVGKARRNYRRSSSGNGLMADVKEGIYAFGGGALYPLVLNLIMKVVPVGADGTPSVPSSLVGAAAAILEHMAGKMVLGTRTVGMGAIGAYAAHLNLPAQFGLNDQLKIRDYLSPNTQVRDYITNGNPSRILLGNRVNDVADIGAGHHHNQRPRYAHNRLNDVADTPYGGDC